MDRLLEVAILVEESDTEIIGFGETASVHINGCDREGCTDRDRSIQPK